ncbi:MAG: hypothetical protein R8K47_03410 [Mariprofundaceae bacterium]
MDRAFLFRPAAFVALLLAGCNAGGSGIELAEGWRAHSLAAWRHVHPDMMVASPNGRTIYISCETVASLSSPSLIALNAETGRSAFLIRGLNRADGLKLAPDGSLWIGEAFDRGLIWRIAEPDRLPADQLVERARMDSSHPAITPLTWAGRFAHEGIAFSRDGSHVWLADKHPRGALFRADPRSHRLAVLDPQGHWRPIRRPEDARAEARRIGARAFDRIEDMEPLPDGRVLLAETGTGRILALSDKGDRAQIETFLERPELKHPDNLAWDEGRGWLWITDDDRPSRLWAWTGQRLIAIARHPKAEITGVLVRPHGVLVNLQRSAGGLEVTLRLDERR